VADEASNFMMASKAKSKIKEQETGDKIYSSRETPPPSDLLPPTRPQLVYS
jgi:hypothetical protein